MVVMMFSIRAEAQGQFCQGADLNGDGVIGVPDFALFSQCMADPNFDPLIPCPRLQATPTTGSSREGASALLFAESPTGNQPTPGRGALGSPYGP
jgi:hypothetical protein